MRYDSNNRYMINTHSFRAYGITKVSRHDSNFAKKLAGQKGYLDEYDRMTDEEKLELYQSLEGDLTIDVTEKQKLQIKNLQKEKEQWQMESELKEKEFVKRLKAEILAEINDPNYRVTDLREADRKAMIRDKQLRKQVGLD